MAKRKSPATKPAVRNKSTKKKGTKKARPKKSDAGPAVRVRMYRQGLGDCFLVTFDLGQEERHMLIDCGSLGATTTGVGVKDVAADLKKVLGNKKLDYLVATHEHKDHLSGFNTKEVKEVIAGAKHVWLAWTEDPTDKDAKALAKYKKDLAASLTAVAAATKDDSLREHLVDILGFSGDLSLDGNVTEAMLGAFAKTIDEAMDYVRTKIVKKPKYLEPGDVLDDIDGFRIYVLGPPRDEDVIKVLGDHDSEELYHFAAGLRAAARTRLKLSTNTPDTNSFAQEDAECPFDPRFNRPLASVKDTYASYERDDWRRIDGDWASCAADLALQMDSLTNNTSLVLAIERIADGRVLLFPGDAQQGNWLSWHDVEFSFKDKNGREQTVRTEELLARTVFYKVGHHGSHNATARAKGLEMMTSQEELVAFIPVDRAVALKKSPKGSWQMPARELYKALLEKCQGRVVRSDIEWAKKPKDAQGDEANFATLKPTPSWTKIAEHQAAAEKKQAVQFSNQYVDYILR